MASPAFRRDALTEVLNIGCGRAAVALSELTQQRVHLSVPAVHAFRAASVRREMSRHDRNGCCITVPFGGRVSGGASLFFDEVSAARLSQTLLPDAPRSSPDAELDALTEIASIVLNAILGSVGNLLWLQVRFGVPQADHVTCGDELVALTASHGADTSLWAETTFKLPASSVTAWFFLHGNAQAIATLVAALDGKLLDRDLEAATA